MADRMLQGHSPILHPFDPSHPRDTEQATVDGASDRVPPVARSDASFMAGCKLLGAGLTAALVGFRHPGRFNDRVPPNRKGSGSGGGGRG